MPELRAGVARANITPPVGMRMRGYGNRKTPAIGTHDELYTVVLYLHDGVSEAALITADLIGADSQGVARVREAAAMASGIPAENIMVAFSHTHGGPETMLYRGQAGDPLKVAYSTVVVHKMAGALAEAKRNAVPARVGYGRQDCSIAVNRREHRPDGAVILGVNREGPTQPFTDVIRLARVDTGAPLGVIFAYACHGTTLGGDNLLYTADYPGAAKRAIEQQLPTALALFIAGCSGDINPYPRGTFEICESHGKRLGCAVVQAALSPGRMRERVRIAVARQEFSLAVEGPPTLEGAKAQLAKVRAVADGEIAEARRAAEGGPIDEEKALSWFTARQLRNAVELVEALERGESDFSIPLEAQALAIGKCAIVGLPGEVFVNIGKAVVDRSPFARTIAISHANGSAGYVPTADQVPLGGYEIEMARAHRCGLVIVPESDQMMINAAVAALRECHDALFAS